MEKKKATNLSWFVGNSMQKLLPYWYIAKVSGEHFGFALMKMISYVCTKEEMSTYLQVLTEKNDNQSWQHFLQVSIAKA